jgi:hypothetical protein
LAKHLRDQDIEQIVRLLDGWDKMLTWELLCAACTSVTGIAPARQTLYRIVRIREAFKAAKERHRNGPKESATPGTMRIAMERIARLTVETQRLTRENNGLLEQFVVWQYNAHVRGMSQADLNRPLPAVDLGNTE